jgi:hypothetical protein
MNNMKALIGLLLILISMQIVYAQTNTTAYCSDDSTLTKITHVTVSISPGSTKVIEATELQHCTFGCGQNECMGPPYWVAIIVFVVVIIAVLIYVFFVRGK